MSACRMMWALPPGLFIATPVPAHSAPLLGVDGAALDFSLLDTTDRWQPNSPTTNEARSAMRTITVLFGLAVLAGCASQRESAPTTILAPTDKPVASTLEEALRMGYKVVDEDGRRLYCRDTPKLGSRVVKERTCLTEEDLLVARDASQRNFEGMKQRIPPPQGLEGARGSN